MTSLNAAIKQARALYTTEPVYTTHPFARGEILGYKVRRGKEVFCAPMSGGHPVEYKAAKAYVDELVLEYVLDKLDITAPLSLAYQYGSDIKGAINDYLRG